MSKASKNALQPLSFTESYVYNNNIIDLTSYIAMWGGVIAYFDKYTNLSYINNQFTPHNTKSYHINQDITPPHKQTTATPAHQYLHVRSRTLNFFVSTRPALTPARFQPHCFGRIVTAVLSTNSLRLIIYIIASKAWLEHLAKPQHTKTRSRQIKSNNNATLHKNTAAKNQATELNANALESSSSDKGKTENSSGEIASSESFAPLSSTAPHDVAAPEHANTVSASSNLDTGDAPLQDSASDESHEPETLSFNGLQKVELTTTPPRKRNRINRRSWTVLAIELEELCQHATHLVSSKLDEFAKNPAFSNDVIKLRSLIEKDLKVHSNESALGSVVGQHLILRHVFLEFFPKAMAFTPLAILEEIAAFTSKFQLDALIPHEALSFFISSLRVKLTNTSDIARQTALIELFDRFFKQSLGELSEKLGIVYTPLAVVDFMNHSVAAILQQDFGLSLSHPRVSLLDPFGGTGTFISRIFQDNKLLSLDNIKEMLHQVSSCELLPLAYLIAQLNIRESLLNRGLTPDEINRLGDDKARDDTWINQNNHAADSKISSALTASAYTKSCDITATTKVADEVTVHEANVDILDCSVSSSLLEQKAVLSNLVSLHDTFTIPTSAIGSATGLATGSDTNDANHANNVEQTVGLAMTPKVKVVFGNPPYSFGQRSASACGANGKYQAVDARIAHTYVAKAGHVTNRNKLYDSYLRAFRWASDYIGECGMVAFVTNASWLEVESCSGVRSSFLEEFSDIYIYHLKGNQRTQGELSRQQGGKIFGVGSRSPIAITILVRNPQRKAGLEKASALGEAAPAPQAQIHFAAIDDYLTREQKLQSLAQTKHILNTKLCPLYPDAHGDWLNQRRDDYQTLLPVRAASEHELGIFTLNSMGFNTNRDAWVINSSPEVIKQNMERSIAFYNEELAQFKQNPHYTKAIAPNDLKWSSSLESRWQKGESSPAFNSQEIRRALYRPFFEQYWYSSSFWNHRLAKQLELFPNDDCDNLCIGVSGKSSKEFAVLMVNKVTDLNFLNAGIQCLPRFIYQKAEDGTFSRTSAISPAALSFINQHYGLSSRAKLNDDDVFFYVYGLLHMPDYQNLYASNLTKELPRIPLTPKLTDFKHIAFTGKKLAQLHTLYDGLKIYPSVNIISPYLKGHIVLSRDLEKLYELEPKLLHISAASYGKLPNKLGDAAKDRSRIILNDYITLSEIPLKAHDYKVNGRSALDHILERAQITTHKESGITNDINDFIAKTGDKLYFIKHILRLITMGIESSKLIKGLDSIDISVPE